VHLDARSVELELHRDVAAEVGESRVQRGSGAGQHGADRAADLQARRLEGGHPAGQRRGRGLREPAGQHERAADARRGDVRRRGDGVQHHALEGALAELAGQQPHEELLLVGGGGREEPGQDRLPSSGRTGAGRPGQLAQRLVDGGDGQRGLGGRRAGHPRQGAPADPQPALTRVARQPRGDRFHLVGAGPVEQVGDGRGLRRS
jgi:hypothetical protein